MADILNLGAKTKFNRQIATSSQNIPWNHKSYGAEGETVENAISKLGVTSILDLNLERIMEVKLWNCH